jgi:hypothetical protein
MMVNKKCLKEFLKVMEMNDFEEKMKFRAEDLHLSVKIFYDNLEAEAPLQKAGGIIAPIICYQAHAPRLRAWYPFDPEPDGLFCNLIVNGHTGCGKSIISHIVKLLMKDATKLDKMERRLLQQCRENNKRKSSNQEKDQEPLVVIRILQDFTLPVVASYADQQERRLGEPIGFFLHSDEVGQICENRKAKQSFQAVARTAFSLREEYIKDTLYKDGYNASTNIVWNSVICSQQASLDDYITKKGLQCGDGSRQIIVDLGEELAPDAPVFHPLTPEQLQLVDATIQKLNNETFTFTADGKISGLKPTHLIDMQFLYDDIKQWCQTQRIQVAKTGSRAHEAFYVRSSVSAFRLSATLYHLWNEQPEHQDKVRRFYLYFAQQILDSQMAQWGQAFEAGVPPSAEKKQPKDVWALMPDEFNEEKFNEIVAKYNAGKEKKDQIRTAFRQFKYTWCSKRKWAYFDEQTKLVHKMFEV